MYKFTLNDLTVGTIINQLAKIVNGNFSRSLVEENKKTLLDRNIPGVVTEHLLKNSNLGSPDKNNRPLILMKFDGSASMVFFEGEVFEWENDKAVTVKTIANSLHKQSSVYVIERIFLSPQEQRIASQRAESNKSYADDYWEDVRRDFDREMEREWLGEDDFF